MTWDRIKELNLDDKLKDSLKSISDKDSDAVENFIMDPDKLQMIKDLMHDGSDSRSIGDAVGLTVRQVDIIKELLGKL